MHSRWRLGLLAREAVRNAASPGSRLLPMLATAVFAGVVMSGFFAAESAALASELDALEDRGRNVVVFQSSDADVPAQIDRRSCDAIADGPDVERAGVVISAGRLDVLPVGAVPVYRASPSLIRELSRSVAVVGTALTEVPAGGELTVMTGSGSVLALAGSEQPAGVGTNSALTFAPNPSDAGGPVCVVVFARDAVVTDARGVVASQLESAGPPLIGTLALRETSDVIAKHLDRPTRLLPVLLGTLTGAAIGIGMLMRSSELAAYRLSGSPASGVLVVLALECCLLGGAAGLSSTTGSLALFGWTVSLESVVVRATVLSASLSTTAGVFSLVAIRRGPHELAKDR